MGGEGSWTQTTMPALPLDGTSLHLRKVPTLGADFPHHKREPKIPLSSSEAKLMEGGPRSASKGSHSHTPQTPTPGGKIADAAEIRD